ncbi:hypothetical protein SNE25_06685 [Mucilaginibacter sabulilitoris]|uniref:Uncharacterized protein n=1 Tax=Mucilaginibacter sabulilitoris TaxID=1173583 RepID=A0ABZ0TR24_9SPHI|nr:hypothetical protein [Mucilaginibacter sabulilitoris]WPU95211.1 hypothetical protein SNE25_06685 [Mucilaginibacter sabulilitoris]
MRRSIFFITTVFSLLLFIQCAKADEPNLKVIRKQLREAINDSKTTDSLYNSLNAVPKKTGIIDGFIAGLQALKAKHAWNPYSKIKHLKNCEKTFEKAIEADPHNIEIRFMRFSVEDSVPGFLGYNKNLTPDSEEIINQLNKKNYGTADKTLTIEIIKFLANSRRCTPAQVEELNKHLVELK